MSIVRRPRVIPPVYFAAAAGSMVVLHWLAPMYQPLDWPWRWAGVVLVVGGLALSAAAGRSFRRHGTTVRPGAVASHLVTAGPYRYTRNPMYVSLALMLIGLALTLGSLSPWLVILAFVWLIDRNVIAWEEQMLDERFGGEYRAYRQRVRRWL